MFPKRQYCVDDRRTEKKRDDQSSVAHAATALWNHSTTVYTYTEAWQLMRTYIGTEPFPAPNTDQPFRASS